MKFKIIFHPDAAREISELDNRQKFLVLKQIKKLLLTPGTGKKLGNKQGLDLSGYRKMYADRKKIRIVYKIVEKTILVQIIAIGKRDNMKVYKKAANRIRHWQFQVQSPLKMQWIKEQVEKGNYQLKLHAVERASIRGIDPLKDIHVVWLMIYYG